MKDIDDLLKRLDNDSRYSQGNCLKCEKGFENHEYHCWGPETDGCMASQKELQITVLQWKKERKEAAATLRALQAEIERLKGEYARGIEDAACIANGMGVREQENYGLNREAQNYYRVRDKIRNSILPKQKEGE